MHMPESIEKLIDDHLSAWNSPPSAQREELIAATYAADLFVGEPQAALTGHDGVTTAIDGLAAQVPGGSLHRTSGISQVQDLVTYTWGLLVDGNDVATGRDILLVADNVITRLYVLIDGT